MIDGVSFERMLLDSSWVEPEPDGGWGMDLSPAEFFGAGPILTHFLPIFAHFWVCFALFCS